MGALLYPLQVASPRNVTFGHREVILLLANNIAYQEAINHTISVRLHDVQTEFKKAELQIGLVGLGSFVFVLSGGVLLVLQQLHALRHKAVHVVDLIILVPRKVAKALRASTQSKLSRVIAEVEGAEDDETDGMDVVMADEFADTVIEDMTNEFAGDAKAQSPSDGGMVRRGSFNLKKGLASRLSTGGLQEKLEQGEQKMERMVAIEMQVQANAERRILAGLRTQSSDHGPSFTDLEAGGTLDQGSGRHSTADHGQVHIRRSTSQSKENVTSQSSFGGAAPKPTGRRSRVHDSDETFDSKVELPMQTRWSAESEDSRQRRPKRVRPRRDRQFSDEWTYTRDGLLRLLLPIGGMFVWIVYLVISLTQLTTVTLAVLERTSITERLTLHILEHSRVMAALVEAQSNTSRLALSHELAEVEASVQRVANLAVLGGKVVDEVAGESFVLSPLSIDTEVGQLFLDDGCGWIEEDSDKRTKC